MYAKAMQTPMATALVLLVVSLAVGSTKWIAAIFKRDLSIVRGGYTNQRMAW